MLKVSEKNIERLLLYRRILNTLSLEKLENIYSHQLAILSDATPEQVRRDIMSIGYSGSSSKGYNVNQLIESICELIDSEDIQRVAIVGVGHLGRSVLDYFQGRRPKLKIAATFDNDPAKINRVLHGSRCYSVGDMVKVIQSEGIDVVILSVPGSAAQEVADRLVEAGIKGILNYAPVKLKLPPNIYVENRDMLLAVEKVAFLARKYSL